MSMNERLVMWQGNEGLKGYKGEGKDDVMVMWGSLFILVAFKTFRLFNIFLVAILQNSNRKWLTSTLGLVVEAINVKVWLCTHIKQYINCLIGCMLRFHYYITWKISKNFNKIGICWFRAILDSIPLGLAWSIFFLSYM